MTQCILLIKDKQFCFIIWHSESKYCELFYSLYPNNDYIDLQNQKNKIITLHNSSYSAQWDWMSWNVFLEKQSQHHPTVRIVKSQNILKSTMQYTIQLPYLSFKHLREQLPLLSPLCSSDSFCISAYWYQHISGQTAHWFVQSQSTCPTITYSKPLNLFSKWRVE